MPNGPRKICWSPGCPQLQPCATHGDRKRAATKTEDERKFYASHRWRLTSERHRREEPLCRQCLTEGRTRLGQMTDHIIPLRQGGDPWDDSNHQTLCNSCHAIKRAHESRNSNEIPAR